MNTPGHLRDIGIYRSSAPWFAALFLFAIPAFWPSYLHPKQVEMDYHVHLHGISFFLWAILLIVQPLLIRAGKWSLHRAIGKVAFALAPLMVVSTVLLAHYRARQSINAEQLYFLYLQFALIAVFAIACTQALRHRRTPALHARYMACTALTMLDPIFARLLYNVFGVEPPLMQAMTFVVTYAILIALWLHDRKQGTDVTVFPRMLVVFVVAGVPTFFISGTAQWLAFAKWFAALPLP